MTDKERLEKIEKNLDPLGYGMGGHLISVNDIYWLVKYAKEQAERVQELESNSYNAHLERLLDRKEQEIERYREALSIISANLPLDGREHYVDIARQALEGEEWI